MIHDDRYVKQFVADRRRERLTAAEEYRLDRLARGLAQRADNKSVGVGTGHG